MATTTETDEERRGLVGERAREAFESMHVAVTGSPAAPMRHVVLFAIMGAVMSFAPQPINAIGVMAMVILAYQIGRMR